MQRHCISQQIKKKLSFFLPIKSSKISIFEKMNSHFYINSQTRTNPLVSPANCSIHINKAIDAGIAELSFFSMPNTWYNITSDNNTLLMDTEPFSITPGCYDLNQLLTELQSVLVGSTIAYNDVLNLINISFGVAHVLDFSQGNMWRVLGFQPRAYASATSFTSSYPPKIYTNILIMKTNLATNMVSNKGHATFIIPVNVNKGELLQFYSRSQFASRPKVNNNNIKAIDIVLCDEFENPLQGCGDFVAIIAICEKNPANKYLA